MSRVLEPDLALRRDGEAIIVVEAKARPIRPPFSDAVRVQMRHCVRQSGSAWALLIDPDRAQIFRSPDTSTPCVEIPSREIVAAGGMADASVMGARVLTRSANRWLRQLPGSPEFLERDPVLIALAEAIGDEDTLDADQPHG